MKKVLCMMIVLVLALGTLCVSVSADKVKLIAPQRGDIRTTSDYITDVKDESTDIINGRVIDASGITAATTLATNNNANGILYREVLNSGEGYKFSGGSKRFKNNWSWEFDFKLDKLPNIGDNGSFYIQIGDAWQNAIKFWATNINTTETKYYLRWGGGTGGTEKISGGDPYYSASKPLLRAGCTYHIKIEADLINGKIYTTFTNPYVTKDASGNWVLNETPAAEGTEVWTFSSVSPNAFTKYTDTLADITTAYKLPYITIAAKSAVKLTLSNEKFYIDRYINTKPEITVENGVLKATTNSVNITNSVYTSNLPTVILGVYNDSNKLMAAYKTANTTESGTASCVAYPYSAEVNVSSLDNGTYTVKAFVWNSVDEMQPYPNCLAEKTLTVTGGVGTLN